MRVVVAYVLVLAASAAGAACVTAAPTAGIADNHPGGDGAAAECAADTDCVAAASSCCACPSFALPASSGWGASCGDVTCAPAPSPGACSEVRAACEAGACRLACNPIACDQSCAGGFAVDAAGCQVCACAADAAAECAADADCAEVRADCCGCANGGADGAVPAAAVAAHDAALMCPAQPACPGVDVCLPDAMPVCERGRCVLADRAPTALLPAGACGRPDLPACGAGLRCVLNASIDATMAGVGLCAP